MTHANMGDRVAAHSFARLRILIVGAGVAGLTLAALLRQRGESPFVIERNAGVDSSGYNLAMYPLGVRALHSLHAHDDYCRRSVPIETYSLHTGDDRRRKQFDIGRMIRRYGTYRGITRAQLIDLLYKTLEDLPVYYDATVTRLTQSSACASAVFGDGSSADFDLVVAADGLYSKTRALILDKREYEFRDTGWDCWTTWAPTHDFPQDEIIEYWGRGCFAGAYPVPDNTGVVLAGPRPQLEKQGRKRFVAGVQKQLGDRQSPVPAITRAFATADKPYLWKLCDCRSRRWRKGRVILLGDAATGILPTAGVGASVAMDSAAALSDEISRTDAQHIDYALRLYEKRQKKRVEAAQTNSRRLARMMLLESNVLAAIRSAAIPFYSPSRALDEIAALMEA